MIHYHGTPITPVSALYELAGRHFCVSHARPEQVARVHEIGQSVMLDNGAFSKWKRGAETDWPAFYGWCERWLGFPTTWAVIPDVINGGSQLQDALVREWPFGHRGAPVWHMDEPLHRLLQLCQEWPRVCIGSTAEFRKVLSDLWRRRMDECWNAIARAHRAARPQRRRRARTLPMDRSRGGDRVTDRPIIFSAPMVRALLDGRKTQTRRILKPQPPEWATFCQQPSMYNVEHRWVPSGLWRWSEPEQSPPRTLRAWPVDADGEHYWLKLRFEQGDRLWVRENCQAVEQPSGEDGVHFIADEAWHPIQAGSRGAADDWLTLYSYGKGRRRGAVVPSIHMPRWASRLTLVVTDVRVERLQDINEADAQAEGLTRAPGGWWSGAEGQAGATPQAAFAVLWNSINGHGAWNANPWVAAISFSVHHANIDALAEPRS